MVSTAGGQKSSLDLGIFNEVLAGAHLGLSKICAPFGGYNSENAQFLLRGCGKFYGLQRLTIVVKWPWLQPEQPRETQFDYGMEDVSL